MVITLNISMRRVILVVLFMTIVVFNVPDHSRRPPHLSDLVLEQRPVRSRKVTLMLLPLS